MIRQVDTTGTAAAATASDKKAHEAAVGFERQLVEQLAEQLVATTEPVAGDDEAGSDSDSVAQSAYRDLLPGTLADAVERSGGIGLSADLERALRGGGES